MTATCDAPAGALCPLLIIAPRLEAGSTPSRPAAGDSREQRGDTVNEALIFLLDLILLGAGAALACAALVAFGGARRNSAALLALGLYALVVGLALALAPQLLWERARTDNAFLGHALFTLLLTPVALCLIVAGARALRGRGRPWPTVGLATLLALAGSALMIAILVARGAGAWQSGSGQFGLDVVAATVAIGAALFVLGRRLGDAPAGAANGARPTAGHP